MVERSDRRGALVNARIYVEGGGQPGTITNAQCRDEFINLLEKCGFERGQFELVASGGRGDAWNDFRDEHADADGDYYVALLIDSERPMEDIDRTWAHLSAGRDNWTRPPNARDDQVLFMTTCMETWIAADRATLQDYFGDGFRPDELPELDGLEERRPGFMNDSLRAATQDCSPQYSKGPVSFELLGSLNPNAIQVLLPSFQRARRILNDKLT